MSIYAVRPMDSGTMQGSSLDAAVATLPATATCFVCFMYKQIPIGKIVSSGGGLTPID
jgi:hypothetical protein